MALSDISLCLQDENSTLNKTILNSQDKFSQLLKLY